MAVKFQIKPHPGQPEKEVVEILVDEEPAVIIYPDFDYGIQIKCFKSVLQDDGSRKLPAPIFLQFSSLTAKTLCQTCKTKPGKPRVDNGLPAGDHCDECWEDMVTGARQQSW